MKNFITNRKQTLHFLQACVRHPPKSILARAQLKLNTSHCELTLLNSSESHEIKAHGKTINT